MFKTEILLNSVNKVTNFVDIIDKQDFVVDLCSRRFIVDARSIMGIFSLDLSNPVVLTAYVDNESQFEEFKKAIKEFLV